MERKNMKIGERVQRAGVPLTDVDYEVGVIKGFRLGGVYVAWPSEPYPELITLFETIEPATQSIQG